MVLHINNSHNKIIVDKNQQIHCINQYFNVLFWFLERFLVILGFIQLFCIKIFFKYLDL